MALLHPIRRDREVHHIVPWWQYAAVFIVLLILTALTVGVATINLGSANLLVALIIAVTKALLVIFIFMGVRYYPPALKMAAAAGFVWLAIFVGFTMTDFLTRAWDANTQWTFIAKTPVPALVVPGGRPTGMPPLPTSNPKKVSAHAQATPRPSAP